MEYRLADYGLVFSTRERGARMLGDLLMKARGVPLETVRIDFDGVRSASYSFIDEFIGELVQKAAANPPRCINASPVAARTIERSLRRRGLSVDGVLAHSLEPA